MPRKTYRQTSRALQLACEPLEPRRLLCGLPMHMLIEPPQFDWGVEQQEASRISARGGPEATSIVWSNRGQASDGFAANFGTSAAAGRAVVDAVLDQWERIITHWNRSDGTITLQVNISITNSNGFGAAAAPAAIAPADGKPRSGSITLSRGNNSPDPNDSNGWFFDPTPFDNSEFVGDILNAYAGVNSAGVGNDFFSVVSAELAHVMGLISDKNNNGGGFNGYLLESSGFVTNTGISDNAEGNGNGVFWVFDGPSVDHLMTSFNSGDPNATSWGNIVHTAGAAGDINFAGKNWIGSEDTGNAIYGDERTLPSFVMTMIFKDAYGYSVINPQNFGTFHAVLNETTGNLLVRGGGQDNSNDVITITASGTQITVSVDVGNDVPGTGALSGAGNLPAYVTTFQAADVNSITINAGDGNDTIRIHGIQSNTPITINAGTGNDTIHLAEAGGNLDVIDSNITVNGGGGTDILRFFDTNNTFGDTFTITNSTIGRNAFPTLTYSGLETIILNCGPGASTFNATSTPSGTGIAIFAGDGNDTFNVGQSNSVATLLGSLTLHGQGGSDTVNYNDSATATAVDYTVNAGAISRTGIPSVGTQTMETITLNAGSASNTITVAAVSSSVSLTVNAGGGNDNLVLALGNVENIAGTLVYNGGTGTDTLTINDTAATGNFTHTINQNSYSRTSFAGFTFNTIESIVLSGGNGNNTYNIDPTPVSLTATVTINAGNGADAFRITPTANNAQFIGGTLTLNGGGGSDSFTLFDSSSSAAMPYTISTSSIVRGVQTMNYSSVETMTIHGTSSNNDFAVASLASSTSATLNGNNGNDRLFMGGVAQNLDNVSGSVVFNGGSGTDTIELRDQQNTRNDTYTMQSTSFARPSMGSLTWGTLEGITVEGGAGANTFQLLNAGVPTTLNGNGGNDHFAIGGSSQANVGTNFAANITVNGGAGTDTVTIFDNNGIGNHIYTIQAGIFDKTDFTSLVYAAVENFTLQANGAHNTINVESLAPGMSYIINGNAGNDTINLAQPSGQLGDLPSPLTLNGGAGTDQLLLFDGSNSGGSTYTVTTNAVTRSGFGGLTYGNGNESLFLFSGTGNDTFNVDSVNIPTTVAGGNGDDHFIVGGGNAAGNIQSLARILGGAGNDKLTINDSATSAANNYTFDSTGFSMTGSPNISYDSTQQIVVDGSQGANTFAVRELPSTIALALNGNGGGDIFNLGSAANSVEPLDGLITIDGGAGSDTVNFNDHSELFAFGFTLNDTTVTRTGMGAVTYGTVERINIHSGGGIGKLHTVSGTAPGTPVRIHPGSATDTINVVETHPGAHVLVNPSGGNDTINVNTSGVGSATVLFDATVMTLGTLNVGAGGLARLAADGTRVLRTVNLTVNGILDLTDNAMIVDYSGASPLNAIRTALTSGYANGAWNGNGINSATAAANPARALGYAEASDIFTTFPATFAGQQVDNTTILVRYTRNGDANLDGLVNLADFNRLAANFGTGTLWSQGNFNYDSAVNLADFNILAANFGAAASSRVQLPDPDEWLGQM